MKVLSREKSDSKGEVQEPRILARHLARELSSEETESVVGAGTFFHPLTSSCGSSDNNPCDLDWLNGDNG